MPVYKKCYGLQSLWATATPIYTISIMIMFVETVMEAFVSSVSWWTRYKANVHIRCRCLDPWNTCSTYVKGNQIWNKCIEKMWELGTKCLVENIIWCTKSIIAYSCNSKGSRLKRTHMHLNRFTIFFPKNYICKSTLYL